MAGIQAISRCDSTSSERDAGDIRGEILLLDTRDSLYSAVILLYFLISVGVVISIVPLLSVLEVDDGINVPPQNSTFPTSNSSNIDPSELEYRYVAIKVTRNLFSCCVTSIFLWLVINKKRFSEESSIWWPDNNVDIHEDGDVGQQEGRCENVSIVNTKQYHDNSLTGAVIFLGTGSGITLFLSFVTGTQCLVYKLQHEQQVAASLVLSTFNNLIYLLLAVAQLLFFYTYDGALFSNNRRRFFHFTMALGIASNTWNWLGVTFTSPVWDYAVGKQLSNYTQWCHGTEFESVRVLNKIKSYLSILFPEYAVMAMSALYFHWKAMVYFGSCRPSVMFNSMAVQNDPNSINSCEEDNDDIQPLVKTAVHHFGTSAKNLTETVKRHSYVLLISAFLAVCYLSMAICSHFYAWIDNNELRVVIQMSVSASIFVPATVVVVFCLQRLTQVSNQFLPLDGNDYLLIFASSWGLLYDLLQTVAIVEMLRCGTYIKMGIASIGVSAVFSTQTCLQTKLLITIPRKCVDTIESQEHIRAGLIFLTLVNVANWLVTGLVHEWAVDKDYVSILAMGFEHADFDSPKDNTISIGSTMILIIYPMLSLYRFHSAAICYEMLKHNQPSIGKQSRRILNLQNIDDI